VLSLAREDEPERHRGTGLRLQHSVFAPPEALSVFVRPGAFNDRIFRVGSVDHLRDLWRRDPGAFLTLLELATGGQDLTLVDDFGDEDDAPRRIPGAAPEQIARARRDEARRKARRPSQHPPRRASSAAS